tara:strand:+ start:109 stop:714 length:606 start_codon:yes stop_codon:yes gene_type:complete
MYKIGITGSIGTGKTTTARLFGLFNIPIFDADNEIKNLLNSEKIKEKLKNKWPKIVSGDIIDKKKLKSIIFSNKNEKKHLEKLLYPYLEIEKRKFEKLNHTSNILVYDVPLIYETNSEKNYDLILLTNCDTNLQRKRVLKRDKISNLLFEKIIKSQLSFKEKVKFKPKVINTNNIKLFILFKIIALLIRIQIKLKITNEKT